MPSNTPTTWRTRDGRVIAIRDMDDGHLLNTLHFLRRRAPAARHKLCNLQMNEAGCALRYAGDAPDGAAMAAESAAEECFELASAAMVMSDDEALSKTVPAWRALQAERRRRKLKELP